MFDFLRPHRYGVLRNVRIHKETRVVERLYVTRIKRYQDGSGSILKKEWKVVDWKTTHRLTAPRACPREHVDNVLRTAF